VENRRVGLVPEVRKSIRQQARNFGRVGSLDTGDLSARLRKTPGTRRDGLIAENVEGGGIPKGNARTGHERPEESELQEGRGAGVISPITSVTALEAGRKPLKSRAIELERATAGSEVQRQEGKRPEKSGTDPHEGQTPEGETLNAAAG